MMIVQKVEIKRQESATTVILLQGICKLESPHFLLIVELLCIHMVSKKPCFFRKGKKLHFAPSGGRKCVLERPSVFS